MVKLLEHQPNPYAVTLPLNVFRTAFSSPFNQAFTKGRMKKPLARKDELVGGLFSAFAGKGGNPGEADDSIPPPLWLLSDENLLGSLKSIILGDGLYPDAGPRIQTMAELFAGHEMKVFMSVRNYRDYYPSAYVQNLKRMPQLSMADFTKNIRRHDRGWVDVVDNVAAAVGKERLFLWKYEDFASHPSAVFKALVPGLNVTDKAILEHRPRNPSLSRKALQCVQRLHDMLSPEELRFVIKAFEKIKFENDEKVRFEDQSYAAALNLRYEADCAELLRKGYKLIG
jgi:hypothetical protein